MVIEKTQFHLADSIYVREFYDADEFEADTNLLSSPSTSPIVQVIPWHARITDTLLSKQTTRRFLHSLESHYLSSFSTEKRRQQIALDDV